MVGRDAFQCPERYRYGIVKDSKSFKQVARKAIVRFYSFISSPKLSLLVGPSYRRSIACLMILTLFMFESKIIAAFATACPLLSGLHNMCQVESFVRTSIDICMIRNYVYANNVSAVGKPHGFSWCLFETFLVILEVPTSCMLLQIE